MYYSIKSGGWQRIAEPTGQEEGLLGIFPYEKMLACGKKWGISAEILEEARRFSYARYDSFENFDCVSLEMLDFENILLSIGSVILYLEKGKAFFFTSKIDIVTALLEECLEGLGERVTLNRVIYSFFELQTKKDDIIFDSIERDYGLGAGTHCNGEAGLCFGDHQPAQTADGAEKILRAVSECTGYSGGERERDF